MAGRQQHDVGLGIVTEGDGAQRRHQLLAVVGDRQHAHGREQLGGEPHHDLAIFQHVRHARRRAHVVLEHVKVLLADPHHVDAGNVGMHAARQGQPLRHGHELGVHQDLRFGNDARLADLALAIGVGQEGIEGAHPLRQPLVQVLPFVPGDDARDDVEGDGGLGTVDRAIGAEGDAVAAIEQVDLVAGRGQPLGRGPFQPARHTAIGRTHAAVRARSHLVECLDCHPAFRPLSNPNISNRRAT